MFRMVLRVVGNYSTVYNIVKHESPGCHLAGPSRPPAHATEESDSEDEAPLRRKQLPPTPKKQTGMGTALKHSIILRTGLI